MPPLAAANHHWEPIEVMEKLVKRLGVKIQYGGNRAFYDVTKDNIELTLRGQYQARVFLWDIGP